MKMEIKAVQQAKVQKLKITSIFAMGSIATGNCIMPIIIIIIYRKYNYQHVQLRQKYQKL